MGFVDIEYDACFTCFHVCFSFFSMVLDLSCVVHIIPMVKCLIDTCVFGVIMKYNVCGVSLVYTVCYLRNWLCVLHFALSCSWNF